MTFFLVLGVHQTKQKVQKPVNNQHIFRGLIEAAVSEAEPAFALSRLQDKQQFAYARAQQDLFDSIWLEESQKFQQLKETGVFSKELLGLLDHRGELFDKVLPGVHQKADGDSFDPSESGYIHGGVTDASCMAWFNLMTEQLEYLGQASTWTSDHCSMAQHACQISYRLLGVWCREDRSGVPPELGHKLVSGCQHVLQSEKFRKLIGEDASLDAAHTVHNMFFLSASLGDHVLGEEIADCTKAVFKVLQSLEPEKFCKQVEDFGDDNNAYDEEYEGDSCTEDGDQDVDDSADEFESEETYWDEADDKLTELAEETADRWREVFRLSLINLKELSNNDHHSESLLDILRESPHYMPERKDLLDVLLCTPDKQPAAKLIEELLDEAVADQSSKDSTAQSTCISILYIASFRNRNGSDKDFDPICLLADRLARLSERQKQEIFTGMEDLLSNAEDFFEGDLNEIRAAFDQLNQRASG